MKIKISMKNPDALQESVEEAVEQGQFDESLSPEEIELVKQSRVDETLKLCNQWFKYGEYLMVEVDTEARTIRIVEADEAYGK